MAEEELKPPVAIDATNLDGSSGSAGQVLQTDGSNTSWVTPSSETVKTVTSNYTTSGETTIFLVKSKYAVSKVSSTGDSLDVSAKTGDFPNGSEFGDSGNKVYVGDKSSVYSYSLSTAYDITTGSFLNSLDVSGQLDTVTSIHFNSNGTKMFITDNNTGVYSYNLSTAYDITTASFNQSFDTTANDAAPQSLEFKDDGTKMYTGGENDLIYSWSLSTAYDISTASFITSFDPAGIDALPGGLEFNSDGTKLIIVDGDGDIASYSLSTAYDISTASQKNTNTLSASPSPGDLAFNNDGTLMVVIDKNSDSLEEYTTTGSPSNITLSSSDVSSGKIIRLKDASGFAGSSSVTIDTKSSETIDGSSSISLNTNYGVKQLQSDGSNWFVISDG